MVIVDVRDDLATLSERMVEAAIGVVTGEPEVRDRSRGVGVHGPTRHDLAVRLYHDTTQSRVRFASEVGQDHASDAERGIEAAVWTVARQGEVLGGAIRADEREAAHHDLAIGLDRDAAGDVVPRPEVGRDCPSRTEGGVQNAGRGVSRHREIARSGCIVEDLAHRDDLAVGLQRQPDDLVLAAEVRRDRSPNAERGVKVTRSRVRGRRQNDLRRQQHEQGSAWQRSCVAIAARNERLR